MLNTGFPITAIGLPLHFNLMPDFLLHFDRQAFYWINHDLTNPFFDWLMPLLRTPRFWIPLYLAIIIFCIRRFKKQGLVIILFTVLSAAFADQTSAGLIKVFYKRLRPCRDPVVSVTNIARVPCGTGYSFPSTHATDHFAVAIFFGLVLYRRWRWVLTAGIWWAASISFAQVYVGVHFPVDVISGALYGSLVGFLFFWIFIKILSGF
jgi:undecaprenyl-diphosphatase